MGLRRMKDGRQDLFVFEQQAVSSDGRVLGIFKAEGIRPKFAEKLKARRL
jgi:pilus assembly protein CpaF